MLDDFKWKLEEAADAVENARKDLSQISSSATSLTTNLIALEEGLRSAVEAIGRFATDLDERLEKVEDRVHSLELDEPDGPDEPDDFITYDPPDDPTPASEEALDGDLADLMDTLTNEDT